MGRPRVFSQRCTVRISRRKYDAISPQDSRRRSLPLADSGAAPNCDDPGMNWRRDVQLAPEYITQTQSGEGLEYGYRRQANQDDRKRRIKLKIRSRNANPEKSKARAGGSGVEASGDRKS